MGEGEKAIVVDVIRRINREAGVTVLFTEHDMDVVFTMADRITVMHEGRRFAEGAPGEVRDDARVQEIYFGGLDADG
jgi:branched-chain amino acid transport system ATP-binding protein